MNLRLKLFVWKKKFGIVKDWLIARIIFGTLALLRLLPAHKAISLADRTARWIGPKTSRHTIALDNLRHAYPEKSADELEQIALDMWGNMARLLAEYVFLDAIFDFDPNAAEPGIVEVSGREIFVRLRDEKRPHIFFTAHTGNFELLPICAAAFDLEVTALFRPPNNRFVAKRVLGTRRTSMGHLVPSKAGAAWSLANVLGNVGNVGMLVDQKFRRGVESTFFGRPVRTNPLLPKLARQFDCDVYPARCVRLPDGRFRLELQEKIELPRNAEGQIDIQGSAQLLNDIVEEWVREYPGQWTWFHKRWN
ncbi:MAG: lipid A biosynthesis lauroyl acyltransferase [Phyllobacterium sp.]